MGAVKAERRPHVPSEAHTDRLQSVLLYLMSGLVEEILLQVQLISVFPIVSKNDDGIVEGFHWLSGTIEWRQEAESCHDRTVSAG